MLVLACLLFPLSTVISVSKDASMATEFEEKRGSLLVTSLRCDKGPHQNIGEGYIT